MAISEGSSEPERDFHRPLRSEWPNITDNEPEFHTRSTVTSCGAMLGHLMGGKDSPKLIAFKIRDDLHILLLCQKLDLLAISF